ncbi:MAG: hypothetical protein E7645_03825 [Ruminococcaceae bacterium]|nr:hypothetical protein [Oscillospiraceae bacterium]
MKFSKLLAVLLAVCLLGTMMIACNKEGGDNETTAPETNAPVASITVTLVVKDGGKEVAREDITYKGATPTLGEIIAIYCAGNDYAEPFDAQGLLASIGDLSKGNGKSWIAFYEEEGKNEAFDSIKDQPVANGQTVVVALEG